MRHVAIPLSTFLVRLLGRHSGAGLREAGRGVQRIFAFVRQACLLSRLYATLRLLVYDLSYSLLLDISPRLLLTRACVAVDVARVELTPRAQAVIVQVRIMLRDVRTAASGCTQDNALYNAVRMMSVYRAIRPLCDFVRHCKETQGHRHVSGTGCL